MDVPFPGVFAAVLARLFQFRDLCPQGRDLGLQRIELVAAHQIEFRHEAVGLGAHRGLGLFAGRLGDAHGGGGSLANSSRNGFWVCMERSWRLETTQWTHRVRWPSALYGK